MKSKDKTISLVIAYIIAVLFIAIFLPQFSFWIILGVSAIFLLLVYLLYVALRKKKVTTGRNLPLDVRRSNKVVGLVAGGILLVGMGATILIGSSKICVEDNYDFTLRAIVLFIAMICLGFGIQIFLQLLRQGKQ